MVTWMIEVVMFANLQLYIPSSEFNYVKYLKSNLEKNDILEHSRVKVFKPL